MAKRQRNVSVLQLCVAQRGVHRGAITAAHVAQWAIVTAELGHVPTTAEYADWWALDERTGWRHRAGVRQVLGDDWQDVVRSLADEITQRRLRSPRSVQALTLA